jgi:hypothetical protein
VRAAAPLLKALAKLAEVRAGDDEAAFAAATQAAPVAVQARLRLALHVQIDVAAETARLGKEIARLQGEIAKAEPSWATRASWPARRPAVVEQERARLADFRQALARLRDQQARLAVVGLKSRAARCLQQVVDAPGHGPGAAHARFARGAGHARRDLQRVDVVQRPAGVQRAGLQAVEPGRGHAAAWPAHAASACFVEQAGVRQAHQHLVGLAAAR